MALAPWGALGSGHFKTDAQRASTKDGRNFTPPSEKELSVSKTLEAIGNKKCTAITSIALAYVMQRTPYVFPICGGRTVEQLKSNIDALSVELSKEEIEEIEKASPLESGFPHNLIGHGPDGFMNKIGGLCDWVQGPEVCSFMMILGIDAHFVIAGYCSSQVVTQHVLQDIPGSVNRLHCAFFPLLPANISQNSLVKNTCQQTPLPT